MATMKTKTMTTAVVHVQFQMMVDGEIIEQVSRYTNEKLWTGRSRREGYEI